MSDYEDFCESYGGCASDPDFMDDWLGKFTIGFLACNDCEMLPKGKLVHIVKLIASPPPARPIGIIWNRTLAENLSCVKANNLNKRYGISPAAWFLERGYTVRSQREGDHWYQVIYKETNELTCISRPMQREYESICFSIVNVVDWGK